MKGIFVLGVVFNVDLVSVTWHGCLKLLILNTIGEFIGAMLFIFILSH